MTKAGERRASGGATAAAPSLKRLSKTLTIASDPEARYRVIAENMRDIILQLDRDEQILYASPSVQMLGYSPEEMIGRRGSAFVHPDDVERRPDNTVRVLVAGESNPAPDRRYRLRLKHGGYRWYEGNPNQLVDESGAVVGILNILRDVHESVLSADARAESEALYRLLADNLSDLIVRYDAKGILRYVSPSIRQFGYAPADLLGRNVSEFVVQEDVPVPLRARLKSDGPLRSGPENAFRVRHQDGGLVWCQGNPSVIRDADGAPIGIVTVVRDITDRRALEEELRGKKDEAERSAMRLKLAVEAGRLAVWQVDQVTGVVHGPEFNAILGYPPEHNLTTEEVRGRYLPGELERLRAVTSAAYARGERNVEVAARFRRLDGKLRWLLVRGEPALNPEGELRASIGVAMDITDRMDAEEILAASEARYRLLADNIGDIIACYGVDSILTFISGATKATLDYEPAELLGRNLNSMCHPDDLGPAMALFRENMRKGVAAAPFRVEYRMSRKDGSIVWLEAHPRAHFGPDGLFVEWQDVIRDITAHKVLEEELREARRTADAATKTKAAFLADMSHELRGPLSSIASFSRLARDRPAVPASVRTALERIEGASVDLIGMVNDILDFSKLEAAEVVFRMQPVSVSELAKAAVELMEPLAHAKDLELLIVDRTPAGLVVSLDQGRVRQVLVNLLGNAVKFTHSGCVTLEVRHDADKRRLSVNVRDTGPGIPADSLGFLFERFTQVSGDGGDSYGGAGLGLAISKAIVEGLGGKISVDTKLGHGSCFSFWVPAAPAAEAFDHEEPTPRLRIVVVHADAKIGGMVTKSLAPLKVEVLTVPDGEAAMKLAARGGVDVILADLQLARASGAALMRLGRRRGSHARVPVLALSLTTNDALYAKVLEEGFHGLIAIPLTPSELTSAIAHAFAFDTGLA